MDGIHLMRFQSETSVFKFLLRSVDGVLKSGVTNKTSPNECIMVIWFDQLS